MAGGFLDASLADLGWSMNPFMTAGHHLAAGRLVDLAPGRFLDVPLFWQNVRLGTLLLDSLTWEVLAAADRGLIR